MLIGNGKTHCTALKGLSGSKECSGDITLQNSLEMAARALQYVVVVVVVVVVFMLIKKLQLHPYNLGNIKFCATGIINCFYFFIFDDHLPIVIFLFFPPPPRHVPNHASKEVVVVMGSLTSCDPGNIFDTIQVCGRRFLARTFDSSYLYKTNSQRNQSQSFSQTVVALGFTPLTPIPILVCPLN